MTPSPIASRPHFQVRSTGKVKVLGEAVNIPFAGDAKVFFPEDREFSDPLRTDLRRNELSKLAPQTIFFPEDHPGT